MDLRIFMEWNDQCGLTLNKMYPFREGIEATFKEKLYGNSITEITIVLICRPEDLKQRKRFKKAKGVFAYDLIVDFYQVKNVEFEEKKKLMRYQMVKVTKETFKNYKFDDFDIKAFLLDFNNAVDSVKW